MEFSNAEICFNKLQASFWWVLIPLFHLVCAQWIGNKVTGVTSCI